MGGLLCLLWQNNWLNKQKRAHERPVRKWTARPELRTNAQSVSERQGQNCALARLICFVAENVCSAFFQHNFPAFKTLWDFIS
jgi:hypothetical protein